MFLSFYFQFHFERYDFSLFCTNQRRPHWGGATEEISAFSDLFKRKTTAFICGDDNSTGDDVGGDYGGEYVDGDVGGGDHGDGDGDYKGDGVTPSVTAIRGSPSPLSHRTACCGSTVMNMLTIISNQEKRTKRACVV